jgi:hypothetical protein
MPQPTPTRVRARRRAATRCSQAYHLGLNRRLTLLGSVLGGARVFLGVLFREWWFSGQDHDRSRCRRGWMVGIGVCTGAGRTGGGLGCCSPCSVACLVGWPVGPAASLEGQHLLGCAPLTRPGQISGALCRSSWGRGVGECSGVDSPLRGRPQRSRGRAGRGEPCSSQSLQPTAAGGLPHDIVRGGRCLPHERGRPEGRPR